MSYSLDDYIADITPAEGFVNEWSLVITSQHETRNGVAWEAKLFRAGHLIGQAFNDGDGGASFTYIDTAEGRQAWADALTAAYGWHAEDTFLAWLDQETSK